MPKEPLSLFHNELLQFLKQEVLAKSKEGGYDPSQLQVLQQSLSPIASDVSLPLSEIIDNYQHLFGVKGPIHIEKALIHAFPPKDFVDLGLTKYFPRVYRGLPRIYHRDSPTQNHIKKNFTHLPTLKRIAAERAVFSLYQNYEIELGSKVVLFTWVISDGLGDYQAAVEVSKILKERFPQLDLQLIALVPKKHHSLPLPDLCPAHLIPYEDDFSLSLMTPDVLTILRSADLILQMSTFYPFTADLSKLLGIPAAKWSSLGEYGFLESSWFHPKTGNRSMGLHFLEMGVLIRKPHEASFASVENEQLLQWLFESLKPGPIEIDQYLAQTRFHMAYLNTAIGGAVYLHALLHSLAHDEKNIDICTPDLGWFIEHTAKQNERKRPVLEGDFGIGSLQVHFEKEVHSITVGTKGKRVRLLCPGMIKASDFHSLVSLSGEFVGVRGNQSFSEAVSANKVFFYDGREHLRYFMKDLAALAENRISQHRGTLTCFRGMGKAFLHNLPVQEEDWVDETFFQELEDWRLVAQEIGFALQDPDTVAGAKKLNRIIAEELSCNEYLCHLVQRNLCHQKHPEIERHESQQMALFTHNQISFKTLITSLKKSDT